MTYTIEVSLWMPLEETWLRVCELTDVPPSELAEFVWMYNKAFLPSLFDYKITLTMEVT